MLADEQLRAFGSDGYLVVRGAVAEADLAELDVEVDSLIARQPPPVGKVGFHHHVEHPAQLPVAVRVLREGGVAALARQLVAPHDIDLAFDHVQVATSIPGWDHRPGGGHIDGYGIDGQTEPATFTLLAGVYLGDESTTGSGNLWVWPGSQVVHQGLFRERGVDALMDERSAGGHPGLLDPSLDVGDGRPVLARRGDVVLAHYLLAHNQSGNVGRSLRRIVYYRLAASGHRERWRETHTDVLHEFAPVRAALFGGEPAPGVGDLDG
ncbi:MAG: phytanoyl-CoA dioxygenase family protein [Actinomycetota bacterium]